MLNIISFSFIITMLQSAISNSFSNVTFININPPYKRITYTYTYTYTYTSYVKEPVSQALIYISHNIHILHRIYDIFFVSLSKSEQILLKEYFKKLQKIHLNINLRITKGLQGGRKSNAKGMSVEFSDFREYSKEFVSKIKKGSKKGWAYIKYKDKYGYVHNTRPYNDN